MKKLKMLTSGPNKNYKKGQVVEVDDARAAILIAGDHAEGGDSWEKSSSKTSKSGRARTTSRQT